MLSLRKTCPKCNASLHVNKRVCYCGYRCVLKRKAFPYAANEKKKVAKRCMRALEPASERINRLEQCRSHMAKRRTLASPTETVCRQQRNRNHMAKKRSLDTPTETQYRQEKKKNSWPRKCH